MPNEPPASTSPFAERRGGGGPGMQGKTLARRLLSSDMLEWCEYQHTRVFEERGLTSK